jgi:UDP-N-acetylmuramate--alanine ligase
MPRFRGVQRIHFVGIGGIGMCGLAELLLAQGYAVSGSDLTSGATVERLRRLGASVAIGHDAGHVGAADVVVVSSAVRRDNPEVLAAHARGVPVIPRAEMLAEVMRLKDGIAVAGTHGKTTTTSLIAHILAAAGLDPTVVVGGRVIGSGAPREASGESERTGARLGNGPFLVAEADESDGSFLHLSPVVAVITNVEPEHLDHYGTADAMESAFVAFANRLPFWGRAVLCIDDPGVQRLLPRIARRRTTYGFSAQAEWLAHDVAPAGTGSRFAVKRGGEALGTAHVQIPGRHNVANALAALAVAAELDVPFAQAADALASFAGVERRFEHKGSARGVRVVDDYGHHPTEIRATLAAAREHHTGRLVVVFQPHRYTRTRDLFDEFSAAFHDADLLVLTEIYAASEPKLPGVEASALASAIRERGHRDVRFVSELEAIAAALVPELRDGDLVLTLGAGSITRLGPQLLAALERRP